MPKNQYITFVEESFDGSGDCIISIPEKLLEQAGIKSDDKVQLEVKLAPSGNILLISKLK
jgi:hypothetical protein